jgi:O-antigen ligase
MRLINSVGPSGWLGLYGSVAIFLLSAISLVVPSGYSYGSLMLVLGTFGFLVRKKYALIKKDDWFFIGVLFSYFIVSVMFNLHHELPTNSYDKPLRFLLAIPVYLVLINYPPKQQFFWWGLIIGVLGACAIAIYQQYDVTSWNGRSNGFLNPIQFGDISMLMSAMVLFGTFCRYGGRFNILIFLSALAGFMASLLSSSRGGWFALPFIFFIFYLTCSSSIRKKIGILFASACVIGAVFFNFLPDSNFLKTRIAVTKTEINSYLNDDHEYTSLHIRLTMWKNGLTAFKARPFKGWGDLAAIKTHYPLDWAALNNIDNFGHFHNEYIDALAKKGVLGLISLISLYLIPLVYFVNLMRTRHADVIPFAGAGVALIGCVMVFGLTQCFLAHNSGTTVFVFYLVIIKTYCRNIIEVRNGVVTESETYLTKGIEKLI